MAKGAYFSELAEEGVGDDGGGEAEEGQGAAYPGEDIEAMPIAGGYVVVGVEVEDDGESR